MPTDRTALLAAGAGVGAFLLGRLLEGSGGGTDAPSTATVDGTSSSTPAAGDPLGATLDFSNAGDYPGVVQGVYPPTDQFGNPVTPPTGGGLPGGGGVTLPPPPTGGSSSGTTPPPAAVYPIPGLKPPAGTTGIVYAKGLQYVFTVSGSTYKKLGPYSPMSFTSYVGPNTTVAGLTFRKITGGPHAGFWLHLGDSHLTFKAL